MVGEELGILDVAQTEGEERTEDGRDSVCAVCFERKRQRSVLQLLSFSSFVWVKVRTP